MYGGHDAGRQAKEAVSVFLQGGGSMMGGLAGYSSPPETKAPEVFGELDKLDQAVEMLAVVSDKLSERLQPVRRQTGTLNGANSATQAPQAILCGVADLIRTRRESVERYTAQLQQALSELEI